MARLIRIGEALKFHQSKWNHEFIIDRFEGGHWYVIQAELKGVTNTCRLDDVAPGGEYVVLPPPPECSIDKIIEFNRAQVGTKYSLLTIIADAIDILSWDWVPALSNSHKRSWVCSGLVNESLRYAGWLHEWVNIYTVMPQQGYDALIADA
jgi:hypothetical protein